MENHFFTDLTISLKTLFFASLLYKSTRSGGRASISQICLVFSVQDGCFYDKLLLLTSTELCTNVGEIDHLTGCAVKE
jgi:hypothetical protein